MRNGVTAREKLSLRYTVTVYSTWVISKRRLAGLSRHALKPLEDSKCNGQSPPLPYRFPFTRHCERGIRGSHVASAVAAGGRAFTSPET